LKQNEGKSYLKDAECAICFENILSFQQYTTKCAHCFCKTCMLMWIQSQYHIVQSRTCPLCRENIEDDIIPFELELCSNRNFEDIDPILFRNNLLNIFTNCYEVYGSCDIIWVNYMISGTPSKDIELYIIKFFKRVFPIDSKFEEIDEEN
jgi:hypothetical protein